MYIKRTSSYVPKTILDNSLFEKSMDTTDEWIRKRTGIYARRTAIIECPSRPIRHMALRAVDSLFLSSEEKSKIKHIVFASGLAEENYPNIANYVSSHLELDIPGIRVNSACSSLVSGFKLSKSLLDDGDVLLVCSESFTSIGDYSDRSSSVLFGDGACCFLLTSSPGMFKISDIELSGFGTELINTGYPGQRPKKTILEFCLENIGLTDEEKISLWESAPHSGYGTFSQDGPEVYRTIITDIPKNLKRKMKESGLSEKEAYFIGHQANLRMLEKVVKRTGLNPCRHLYNVDKYGNTGAPGCGIVLDEEVKKKTFRPGDKILFSAFGAGIVYGFAVIERL